MAKKVSTEAQDARDTLARLLPAGSTAHTIVRHVTANGMGRAISVIVVENGEPWDISHLVQRAEIGFNLHPRERGIKVQGTGMDMAFHLVYSVSSAIHGDGYAISQRAL